MRARRYCPNCFESREHPSSDGGDFSCARCAAPYVVRFDEVEGPIQRCAFCGNRTFFVQKDFDQRLGCLLMAISLALALLAGWKLGWIWFTPALLASVVVDWIVAPRIGAVTICYRCDAEYRDLPLNPRHRDYDPHVAERYAATKTVRRMR